MSDPYRIIAPMPPKPEEPMDHNTFTLKTVQACIAGVVALTVVLCGTNIWIDRHQDETKILTIHDEAAKAHDEAAKAMFDHMPIQKQ